MLENWGWVLWDGDEVGGRVLRLEERSQIHEGLSQLHEKEYLAVCDWEIAVGSLVEETRYPWGSHGIETYALYKTDKDTILRVCKNYLKHTIYYGKAEALTK